MKVWQQPAVQVLALFLLLGAFGWWTFRSVSLPTSLRDLFEEDQAIAAAATPGQEEDPWMAEWAKLPPPPEEHAPEVAALLARLQGLPPIPPLLELALRRDAAASPGEPPSPWNESELKALEEVRTAFREAWEPFLAAPPPVWQNHPDSIALFRFQGDFLSADWGAYAELVNLEPGNPQDEDRLDDPEFQLRYLGQLRRLGTLSWSETDGVGVSARIVKLLEEKILPENFTLETLQAVRRSLSAALTLEDLRAGLDADRALLLRAAQYLSSLPAGTSPDLAMARWLGRAADTGRIPWEDEKFPDARAWAAQLKEQAAGLEALRQKTFLAGPAWRQWLAGNPESGLSPWLARRLAGMRFFERNQKEWGVICGALDVRIALEENDGTRARRIPDPLQPGSFFQIEATEAGVRTFCSYIPDGEEQPASFRLPDYLRPAINPTGGKNSPDGPDR